MSRAGLGRTRAGCRALRAERVSRASMLALRMRTSRSERPGEERRRCWDSSWLVAGAEIHQDVADAELFNEAEGFLAGAGAYGEHADDAADAEDDAEGSEQSARLLSAQVGDGLAEVGEKDHWGAPDAEYGGQTGLPANFRERHRKFMAVWAVPVVAVIGRGPSWRCRIVRRRI